MEVGEIYVHDEFYTDTETGELLPKYFVVLAIDQSGDIITRLLTSRHHGRPQDPRCFHGQPYASFYFGPICSALPLATWLDLRAQEDFDLSIFEQRRAKKAIRYVHTLARPDLRAALECTASADDTTIRQETCIRDQLGKLAH
jgi:hypothetical protein